MKNWKKFLGIVILVILLGIILEASSYLWQSNRLIKQGYRFMDSDKPAPYPTKIISFSENYFNNLDKDRIIKNLVSTESKNTALTVFGDVYANSFDNQNDTFAHKLAKKTNRPVHNLAEAGWGISQMYFLLKNEKEIDSFNPEAIVFFYHKDMRNRLTSFSFYPHHSYLNLKYKLKNNELIEDKPLIPLSYKSYAVRNFERFKGWRTATCKNPTIQQKNFDLIQKLFEESKTIAQAKYPNLKKFIILRQPAEWETLKKLEEYKANDKIAEIEYNMWQNLKNAGFMVIDITELTDVDMNNQENHSSDSSLKPEIIDAFMPVFVKVTELEVKKPIKKPSVTKKRVVKKDKKQSIKTTEKTQTQEDIKIQNTDSEKEITPEKKEAGKFKRFISKFKRKKDNTVDN